MANLGWCKRQKDGPKFTEPNDNLCNEYYKSAEETLAFLRDAGGLKTKSNMWLATTKYYCEYFAVYALLMKIGIKSEIHDCTIEICSFLEKEGLLSIGTYKKLEEDKRLRIDNQYYLKNIEVKIDFDELVNFILDVKRRINLLTLTDIDNIRKKLALAE